MSTSNYYVTVSNGYSSRRERVNAESPEDAKRKVRAELRRQGVKGVKVTRVTDAPTSWWERI